MQPTHQFNIDDLYMPGGLSLGLANEQLDRRSRNDQKERRKLINIL